MARVSRSRRRVERRRWADHRLLRHRPLRDRSVRVWAHRLLVDRPRGSVLRRPGDVAVLARRVLEAVRVEAGRLSLVGRVLIALLVLESSKIRG